MRQLLASAATTTAAAAQDFIAIVEKLVALFVLVGTLGFRLWRSRRRRHQAESHARQAVLNRLDVLARATLVLLEEANYRDWSTSTGRLVTNQENPNVVRGIHRAKRQAVTNELRTALGLPDRRVSQPQARADFSRRLKE